MRIFLYFIIFHLNSNSSYLMNAVIPSDIPPDPLNQDIAADDVEDNIGNENESPSLDNPNQTNAHAENENKMEQEEKIGTEKKIPELFAVKVEPVSLALKEIRSQISSNQSNSNWISNLAIWISSIGIICGMVAICIAFFWAIFVDKRHENRGGHNGVSHSHLNGGNGGTKQNQGFFLIGGIHDPFDLSYLVTIRDNENVEHKSAERYYWYKMAQHFGEEQTMTNIRKALKVEEAEEVVKQMLESIKSDKVKLDEWDKMKLTIWEEAQALKFNQIRWIENLLVLTKNEYLAVASDDDFFGTGVRKISDVAYKPNFWHGKNNGGKKLMDIRDKIEKEHKWIGQKEEEESLSTMEIYRNIWVCN